MARPGRTWWGERFIAALETCMDSGRLTRGRSYRSPRRILEFTLEAHQIQALVRGHVNPYFGVYKEPRYEVRIALKPLSAKDRDALIKRLSGNAAWLSKLLLNEMPDNIEQAFSGKARLLPQSSRDLKTQCSCPDWANPCKHVAGVYFRLASLLDSDPLILFQLRGLSKKKLHDALSKSPLGKALLPQLAPASEIELQPDEHRYTHPARQILDNGISLKSFWSGEAPLPALDERAQTPGVPAIQIKKQGDYPPFWDKDNSFIEAMEAIYEQVRLKNTDSL